MLLIQKICVPQLTLAYYLKYLTFSSGKTDQSKFGSGDLAAYINET